jgi:phosphatidate cytidylyltransferase
MANATDDSVASPPKRNPTLQRLFTVLPLVPVLVLAIWWDVWSVTLVVIVASIIGLAELFTALTEHSIKSYAYVGYVYAVAVIATTYFDSSRVEYVLIIGLILSLVVMLRYAQHPHAYTGWALTIAAVWYIAYTLSYIVRMRAMSTPLSDGLLSTYMAPGVAWIITTLASTWLCDTFAYFSGRHFGKHLLAPHISPKKTWEGSIGGVIGAILTSSACIPLFGLPIPWWGGIIIGVMAGIVGPLGDLAESLIKRQLGIKDLGTLFPGHGGMLDRIDSVIFMVPLVYVALHLFGIS